MGKVMLSLCLSIHTLGGGAPHLHPIILPLVPCPFWVYPSDWSQVPSLGGWYPRWGYPAWGRSGLGYPPPPHGQDRTGVPRPPAKTGLGYPPPPADRTAGWVLARQRAVCPLAFTQDYCIVTARIRRMTGGYIFSLCVSPHGGVPHPADGGVPPSQVQAGGTHPADGGYPLPRSRWGVPHPADWGGTSSQVQAGGTPSS